jgi:hypothetical protein
MRPSGGSTISDVCGNARRPKSERKVLVALLSARCAAAEICCWRWETSCSLR